MEIKAFEKNNIDELEQLIRHTIDSCYSGVYCDEAIAYFKDFHSRKNIEKDAGNGITIILCDGSRIIGTGTLLGPEIRRVFVLKAFQGRGLGKLIMNHLEKTADGEGIGKVTLCSSLVSKAFYDRLGYTTISKEYIDLGNERRLEYYTMHKIINAPPD